MFPPVLHLHLMRFQYDPQSDASVKFNDRLVSYCSWNGLFSNWGSSSKYWSGGVANAANKTSQFLLHVQSDNPVFIRNELMNYVV